jgi:sulfur carrier protein
MIQIDYNGILENFEGTSLKDLLNQKEILAKSGVAIAVNNEVISKLNWENHQLQNEDKILVITAAAGG